MHDFAPLWNMLKQKNISTYDLEYHYNLNPAEISRLKNNHNFTLKSIEKYCRLFKCKIEDIVTFTQEDE